MEDTETLTMIKVVKRAVIQVVVKLTVIRTAAKATTEIARRGVTIITVVIVVETGVEAQAMTLRDELAKACLRCLSKVSKII